MLPSSEWHIRMSKVARSGVHTLLYRMVGAVTLPYCPGIHSQWLYAQWATVWKGGL